MSPGTTSVASKTIAKAVARYRARLLAGERIMRDATGRMSWANTGRPVARKTVHHMLEAGELAQLDADLFGNFNRGQTLGVAAGE